MSCISVSPRRVVTPALAAALLVLSAPAALAEWRREAVVFHGQDDKPCRPAGQPCVAGWSKFDPGPPAEYRIVDAGEGHVTFGKRIPNRSLQPNWSQIRATWQSPPAVLRPGQKITFDIALKVQTPGWANFGSTISFYRMAGPGGEQAQLGTLVVSDASGGGAKTTPVHVVPDGFGANRDDKARLRYMAVPVNGGSGAGKVIFSYVWVP